MQPLVSCILPTHNRAHLIQIAIDSYLSQDYLHKELVIVDSGSDDTEARIPKQPSIRYFKTSPAGSEPQAGTMRNRCCEKVWGELICHFDSDDWSAPSRITDQVEALQDGILIGYCDMLFYDVRDAQTYYWSISTQRFALGTSFLYRKDWWQQHPFEDLPIGEDFKFFYEALRLAGGRVQTPSVKQMMVALVHEGQTSPKNITSSSYQKVAASHLPEAFRALQHHYQPR